MGSAAAASSSKPKKNSVVDRRKRKNPKSRKRRRVSSSPSSSSSVPDDVSRRQGSSRRKTEKKRGRDEKRSIKRKHRKSRHRSVSSASRDSSGSSDRSRSPIRHHRDDRKGKLKKVKRGRKLDVAVRSSKNRYRSPSCSTSSGRETQNNTRRIHNYREDKNKKRDDSRQIGSFSSVESREVVDERCVGEGRKIDNEISKLNYDDLPPANTDCNVESFEQDWAADSGSLQRVVEMDRWMSERNLRNDSYFDQFEDSERQTSEFYNQLEFNSNASMRMKSEIIAACNHDSESEDLELILRKKALENLKKLRSVSAADESSEIPNESAKKTSEKPHESAKKINSSSESGSVISKHGQSQVGVLSDESNMNTVNKLTPMELNYSTCQKEIAFSHLNESRISKQLESSKRSQNTSNHPNLIENSPEKISYRQSPRRSSSEKDAIVGFGSGSSLRAEVSLGEELASGNTFPNEKEKAQETNDNVKEFQSGSQFEKKTFSRIHDGETVQVSYKVYIPNKAPALARRKLQR
ncbi:hypothetical protein KSP39_PZI002460 [Platanthera zijinensis]|uniref:Uncharacterized protein n=1 Tax=Platanthera zijinensis TaxID=2320716 RepID=A0AAP0BZ97_9ASPA